MKSGRSRHFVQSSFFSPSTCRPDQIAVVCVLFSVCFLSGLRPMSRLLVVTVFIPSPYLFRMIAETPEVTEEALEKQLEDLGLNNDEESVHNADKVIDMTSWWSFVFR